MKMSNSLKDKKAQSIAERVKKDLAAEKREKQKRKADEEELASILRIISSEFRVEAKLAEKQVLVEWHQKDKFEVIIDGMGGVITEISLEAVRDVANDFIELANDYRDPERFFARFGKNGRGRNVA